MGLVHGNLVSPCRSFSHLLAELFSLFSPLNFLTELSLFYYSISLISLIKQLFPDPRRRRPCFEFPGSTGAGPQQVAPEQAGAVSLFHHLCTNGSNNFLYMRGFWISVSSPVCFSCHRNFLWNLRSHVSKPNSFSSSKNPCYSY